jgi:toxin ParE1/3/4
MRIDWSAHALADLKAISEFIEDDRSVEVANRVIRRIYDAIQTLRSMPFRGRVGRVEGTRELVVPGLPYVIVYEQGGEIVLVLNVVHGAQKQP